MLARGDALPIWNFGFVNLASLTSGQACSVALISFQVPVEATHFRLLLCVVQLIWILS